MQFNAPYNDIPLLCCSSYGSVLPLVQMSLSFVSNEFASIQYFWKRKKKENLMQTKEKIDGKAPQYSDCEIPATFVKCQVYHK